MPTAIGALQHVHIIEGMASAVARSGPFEPEKSRVSGTRGRSVSTPAHSASPRSSACQIAFM
jgi:hypothetical protein